MRVAMVTSPNLPANPEPPLVIQQPAAAETTGSLPQLLPAVLLRRPTLPLLPWLRDRLGVATWRLRSWDLYWKQAAASLLIAASVFALWLYLVAPI